jgi:hypothetical protein
MNLVAGLKPRPQGEAGGAELDSGAGVAGGAAVRRDRNRPHLPGGHADVALRDPPLVIDLVVLIEALLVDIDLVVPTVPAPRHADGRSTGERVRRVAVEARRS